MLELRAMGFEASWDGNQPHHGMICDDRERCAMLQQCFDHKAPRLGWLCHRFGPPDSRVVTAWQSLVSWNALILTCQERWYGPRETTPVCLSGWILHFSCLLRTGSWCPPPLKVEMPGEDAMDLTLSWWVYMPCRYCSRQFP